MWKFHCCLNGSYLSTHSMKLCQNSASSLAIGKLIYNVRHIIFTHIAHGEREKRYLKTSSLQICTRHIYIYIYIYAICRLGPRSVLERYFPKVSEIARGRRPRVGQIFSSVRADKKTINNII